MASLSDALSSVRDQSDNTLHIVNISGGKDSAALAVYIRTKYPEIHDTAEYVFCDTECELEETEQYLENLESFLSKKIKRLNARDSFDIRLKPGKRKPFDVFLEEKFGGYLPSPQSRWCTRALKIEPFERFVGQRTAYSYIGIRADENRDGYLAKKPPSLSNKQNIIPVYPFRDDGLGLADIKMLLESNGVGLPSYYEWRSRSGCYFCFYQQIGEWQRLKKNHPDLFEKAKDYERLSEGFTWCEGRTLDEIAALPEQPLPILDESSGCAICHL
ncbi:MAG TPA: phosphoadenosine phosphosulfate reductase [Planctomycetaceae bacterium]|nr:phosphoadenosine phosphosulfate reductase [Planctomycetaceae bacterium]